MNLTINLARFGLVLSIFMTGCMQDKRTGTASEKQPVAPPNKGNFVQYVAVPESARAPDMPAKGYLLDDLGDGLYGVRNGSSNSMFLVTSVGVVVVDAGNPNYTGKYVMQAIREVTDLPITHFIYSHSHADHVSGAAMFKSANVSGTSPQYIAHERAAERLRRMNDPRRPIPTVTFPGDHFVLEVGGSQLILDYHGDLHSPGDLFIYAPKQKVLMLVDVIAPRWAPYFKLGHTPDVPRFMEVTKQILAYDFQTFIGGHVGWYGTRADVEEIGRYLDDLMAACRKAYAEEPNLPEVDPKNSWGLSQTYYEGTARRCTELMPTSWLTKLGGADVFLQDNAHSLIYSLLTDYPPATP
ncbi:MAG: MBL fold metallo-hydrolase [Pyrinomonadaceae bacterium]